jgi:hypothetical protein
MGPLTVWGETVRGDLVTMLDGFVSLVPVGARATLTISASTLLLGAHATPESVWQKQIVGTANLHEWLPDTGLRPPEREMDAHGQTTRLSLTWESPEPRGIALPHGKLVFGPVMDTKWAYSPDWSISTGLDAVWEPSPPVAIDDLYAHFVAPLLSLTVFASDRPDSLISEVIIDPDARRRARVLRRGALAAPREWRPITPTYSPLMISPTSLWLSRSGSSCMGRSIRPSAPSRRRSTATRTTRRAWLTLPPL